MALEALQANQVDSLPGQEAPLIGRDAVEFGEQFDVALHGPPGEQGRVLKDVAESLTVDVDRPGGRFQQPGCDSEQGGFAAA